MNEPRRGYLVFTTHDRDEVDATFVPETEVELIERLKNPDGPDYDDSLERTFSDWEIGLEAAGIEPIRWHSQTRCHEAWPFNGFEILGTFYHLVY